MHVVAEAGRIATRRHDAANRSAMVESVWRDIRSVREVGIRMQLAGRCKFDVLPIDARVDHAQGHSLPGGASCIGVIGIDKLQGRLVSKLIGKAELDPARLQVRLRIRRLKKSRRRRNQGPWRREPQGVGELKRRRRGDRRRNER